MASKIHRVFSADKVRRMIMIVKRREFINLGLIASASAVIATLAGIDAVQAKKKPEAPGVPALDPNDPQAQALHYTHDAADAVQGDGKTTAADAGQNCANCQLFSGTPGREWGPCAIFSYRVDPESKMHLVVSSAGWCQAWAPRAGARQSG
jgi:hypothetical protein